MTILLDDLNVDKLRMSKIESVVKQIEKGNFEDYHVRRINGLKTPVSNPDRKEANNLD